MTPLNSFETRVLVADHDDSRAKRLMDVLRRFFRGHVERKRTWAEVKTLLETGKFEKEKERIYDEIALLVLPQDLTDPGGVAWLTKCFKDVLNCQSVKIWQVLGLATSTPPYFDRSPAQSHRNGRAHLLIKADLQPAEQELHDKFREILGLPENLPEIPPQPKRDVILEHQISSLDSDGRYEEGEANLKEIIRAFWACDKANVKRLGQGFSGDLVLQVDPVPCSDPIRSYVLKIIGWNNRQGIQNEVDSWKEIMEALNPFGVHSLIPPRKMLHEFDGVVSEKDQKPEHFLMRHPRETAARYAVAYGLLGENIGKFVNLEAAYTVPRDEFEEEFGPLPDNAPDPAAWLADKVLLELRKSWYDKCKRGDRLWWDGRDVIDPDRRKEPSLPPYGLSRDQKAILLTSLVELRPFGVRLLPASWKADEDTVSSWVEAGAKDQAAFRDERPVVLSRVHGDLNKANVLLWVNKAHPFLIDFTTYQKEGHALQDFAHLEADIKFLLMDRDGEPGLKGLDHTAEQLPLWCEAETHLASEGWSLTKVPSSKMVKNVARRAAAKPNKEVDSAKPAGVKRGVGMIKTLRCAAQEVHRIGHGELSSDATFMAEYGMALLYHTLLVIRYKEISPFKRLLAVFSAARLIDLIPTLLGGYEHSSARV